MARKKDKIIQPLAVKILILCAGVIFIGLIVYNSCVKDSRFFTVTEIFADPTMGFEEDRDIRKLKGKNIFAVNLREITDKLIARYPYITDLRVVKKYPNRILITAKRRLPLAQAVIQGSTLTLDEHGVIISKNPPNPQNPLPLVYGITSYQQSLGVGWRLRGAEVDAALKIVKEFQSIRPFAASYKIVNIHAEDVSRIILRLSNYVNVIMDSQNIQEKASMLALVLPKVNPQEIQYIDLRFTEPIIKKKDEK